MKILAFRGANLASLPAFEIDLTRGRLAQAGVFAITGPTGAGKSTLLDAICLALYDKVPRLASGGTVQIADAAHDQTVSTSDPRSLLRRGAASGFAEVDFRAHDGDVYRARWEVRRARDRASGRLQPQQVTLTRLSDGHLFGDKKTETLDAIQRLIQLDFGQFCRSVLLAQGDFAAFLHANARERGALLEAMTDTRIYSALSRRAHLRGTEIEEQIDRLQIQLNEHQVLPDDERATAEQTLDEARTRQAQVQATLQAAQGRVDWWAEHAKHTKAVNAAALRHQAAQQAREEARPREEALAEVEQAHAHRSTFDHAKRVEARLSEARNALAHARAQRQQAEQRATEASGALPSLRATHQQAIGAQDEAQPDLDRAAQLDAQIAEASDEVQRAHAALTQAQNAANALDKQASDAERALRDHDQQLEDGQRWLDDHADDEALSRHHAALESLLQRNSRARDAQQAVDQALPQAEQTLQAAQTALDHATQAAKKRQDAEAEARAALDVAQSAVPEGQPETLRDRRQALHTREAALRACLDAAQAAHAARERAQEHEHLAQTATTRAERARRAHAQAQDRKPTLHARLEEARRSLTQLERAAGLDEHRANLVDGEPCPLCGATEHPWAGGVPALAHEQGERVNALQHEWNTLVEEISQAQTAATHAEEQAATARASAKDALDRLPAAQQAWAARHHAAGLDSTLPDSPEPWADVTEVQHAVDQERHTLSAEEDALEGARRAVDQARGDVDRSAQAARQAEAHRTQAASAHRDAETAAQKLLAARHDATDQQAQAWAELDALLPSTIHRAPFQRDPARTSADWLSRARAWQDRAQAHQRQVDARPPLAEAASTARAQAQAADQALRTARDDATTRQRKRDKLTEQRAKLLGGQSVEQTRRRLRDAVEAADKALRHGEKLDEEARQASGRSKEREDAAQDALGAAQGDHEHARAELQRVLTTLGIDETTLTQRLERPPAWIAEERARLQALRDAVTAAESAQAERQAALEEHRRTRPEGTSSPEDAHAEVQAATLRHQQVTTEVNHASLVLHQDDARREKAQHLRAQIERAREEGHPWIVLKELIGSFDGKKFRDFAQSLALDALLHEANHHLRQLNPRYRLQRIRHRDLEIQVLDAHHADEPRAIHTLSGGETFLASLALALGLSSMAADRAPIGSLFIDEGFGTLDAGTLDIALDTLHGLERQGRQVGLISHVPGIGEKLGVEIEVRKLGDGRSEVRVR